MQEIENIYYIFFDKLFPSFETCVKICALCLKIHFRVDFYQSYIALEVNHYKYGIKKLEMDT